MAKSKVTLKVKKGDDPRVPVNSDFDTRDRLAELVSSGNLLKPDDKAAIYGSLISAYGQDKAAKIMNHAYIFNQRGDVQNLPIEDKLKAFYAIGSNDPEVSQILNRSKSLGYGVVPGFREGSSAINQELSGRVAPTASGVVNPAVVNRVRLRVSR